MEIIKHDTRIGIIGCYKYCPMKDGVACCQYSPHYKLSDISYLLQSERGQAFLDNMFNVAGIFEDKHLVLNEYSFYAVRSLDKKREDQICPFHSVDCGCVIPFDMRTDICRQYMCDHMLKINSSCSSLDTEDKALISEWTSSFSKVFYLNNAISQVLERLIKSNSVIETSLKVNREYLLHLLTHIYPYIQGLFKDIETCKNPESALKKVHRFEIPTEFFWNNYEEYRLKK